MSESMAAFDRAEFDELLREVVALREWKAAHEAAAFRAAGEAGAPDLETFRKALNKLQLAHGEWARTKWDHPEADRNALADTAVEAENEVIELFVRAGASGGQDVLLDYELHCLEEEIARPMLERRWDEILGRVAGIRAALSRAGEERPSGPWTVHQDVTLGDNRYVTRPGNSPGVTRYSGPFTIAEARTVVDALNRVAAGTEGTEQK